ncbi:ZN226-like protein [Mya arenaria]|uniref:ZN226-like protein n=1 Tax=Mya arenaria TaxID=6604 RepID=A0ABY7F7H1_MYAAR|nr:ZN226-like protein [Mya arenaria]
MATPDMDVIKEIPGYKVILKAVLKSQIQQLVEQLATTTDEESVILTASVGDGTLSHHKQKQEKMEKERQEALARVAPVTPPRYGGMGGPRASYMPQRSPRFTSPRNQGPHPVALSRASTGALRNTGQGGARHEPYPTQRAPRRGSLSFDQGPGPRSNVGSGGQVIKVEPTDDEQSNQSAPGMTGSDTAQGSSEPSSPSVNQTGLQQSTEREDDAKSESSSSTIPNESSDLKQTDNVPPGGLSLGSDLSSLIPGVATTTSESVHDTSGMDPNVSVKLEAGDDGDMDLEITGVELGSRPGDPVMASSQDWAQQAMGGMPTGASGGPGDMTAQQGYNYVLGDENWPNDGNCLGLSVVKTSESFSGHRCTICGLFIRFKSAVKVHMMVHTGEKPFRCEMCGKSFRRRYHLKTHLVTHASANLLSASPLRHAAPNMDPLHQLQGVHSMQKNVPNQSMYQTQVSLMHPRTTSPESSSSMSSGMETLNCPDCGAKYRFRSQMEIHRRIHTGDKPFN